MQTDLKRRSTDTTKCAMLKFKLKMTPIQKEMYKQIVFNLLSI